MLIAYNSLLAQPAETLLEYASSTIASHFLDCVLTSEAVPPKHRRRLISAFLGHYRELAQDRMGSRVADTIWAKADGFMKVSSTRATQIVLEGEWTGEMDMC
jgi:nucleolar protein 9